MRIRKDLEYALIALLAMNDIDRIVSTIQVPDLDPRPEAQPDDE